MHFPLDGIWRYVHLDTQWLLDLGRVGLRLFDAVSLRLTRTSLGNKQDTRLSYMGGYGDILFSAGVEYSHFGEWHELLSQAMQVCHESGVEVIQETLLRHEMRSSDECAAGSADYYVRLPQPGVTRPVAVSLPGSFDLYDASLLGGL